MLRWFAGALTIRHVDAGSATAASWRSTPPNNPYYNLEGLGIRFVASPRHADMLLVTGPVSRNMEVALGVPTQATLSRSWSSRWAIAAAPVASSARAMRAAAVCRTSFRSMSPCPAVRPRRSRSCRVFSPRSSCGR